MGDGFEVRLQFELGENNRLITAVCSRMADDYKSIDMALWEKTERNLGTWGSCTRAVTVTLLEGLDLEGVGDHIAVRNHYSFLFAHQLISD